MTHDAKDPRLLEEAFGYLGKQATDEEVHQLAAFVAKCIDRYARTVDLTRYMGPEHADANPMTPQTGQTVVTHVPGAMLDTPRDPKRTG